MELTTMRYQIEGAIAHVILNRPDTLNAMNLPWSQDFLTVTETLARERKVKVIVISGAGRAFCSGIDLKTLAHDSFPMEWFRTYERALRNLEIMDKIVICAMHRYCIGGGLQVALASDIRIASENTEFALTAVKECLIPGMGTFRLARYVGLGRAKRIILSGEYINARQAYDMGLVDYLVPDADFERRVKEISDVYLKTNSEGQRQSKRLLDMSLNLEWEPFLEEYLIAQKTTLTSPEHLEAAKHYREKGEHRF
jgi:enoyl-CoA hydratase/carnithine racemase